MSPLDTTPAPPEQPPRDSLCAELKSATWALHRQTEGSELMRHLLQGQLPPRTYGVLLASLLPIYQALEAGLDRHTGHPHIAPWRDPDLRREPALQADLHDLQGPAWAENLACPAAARDYASHLTELAAQDPTRLVAHAYVRYLGDLHGGQVLGRLVTRHLTAGSGKGVAFYDFGGEARVAASIRRMRAGLDGVAWVPAERQRLVDEARSAYERHGRLFDEIAATPA